MNPGSMYYSQRNVLPSRSDNNSNRKPSSRSSVITSAGRDPKGPLSEDPFRNTKIPDEFTSGDILKAQYLADQGGGINPEKITWEKGQIRRIEKIMEDFQKKQIEIEKHFQAFLKELNNKDPGKKSPSADMLKDTEIPEKISKKKLQEMRESASRKINDIYKGDSKPLSAEEQAKIESVTEEESLEHLFVPQKGNLFKDTEIPTKFNWLKLRELHSDTKSNKSGINWGDLYPLTFKQIEEIENAKDRPLGPFLYPRIARRLKRNKDKNPEAYAIHKGMKDPFEATEIPDEVRTEIEDIFKEAEESLEKIYKGNTTD